MPRANKRILTLEKNLVDQNIGADQVRCVGFHQCSEDFPPQSCTLYMSPWLEYANAFLPTT